MMAEQPVTIKTNPGGPFMVSGEFTLHDTEGNSVKHSGRAALCRCGASAKKPLCDGAHGRIGFEKE